VDSLDAFRRRFESVSVEARCLCGADAPAAVRRRDRYGIAIHVVLCRACGHVYARRRLPATELASFYADSYRVVYGPPGLQRSPEKAALKIGRARRHILPVFERHAGATSDPLVIEWGASAGWNLVPFRERGIRTIGFDFDADLVQFGRQQFDLDLRRLTEGTASLQEFRATASFIIANHVLEHVDDPFALLGELAGILRPDGVIYVGLPLLENIADWGWHDFFHVAHLHYFSRRSFAAMAESRGFDIVASQATHDGLVLRAAAVPRAVTASPSFMGYHARLLIARRAADLATAVPRRLARRAFQRVPGLSAARRRWRGGAAAQQ
jgi:SAM-dependent methyltransferase